MTTDALVRIFSTLFFPLYLLIAFAWPSIRTYLRTGINPVTFGSRDDAHDFIGKWFKILIGLMLVPIIGYWFPRELYQYLAPFDYLRLPAMQLIGAVLATVSLVWISVAQYHMNTSWRIGLDKRHKTALIQDGLFRVSRNPVFLGMLVSLLGFFLLLPNAVTFLVLTGGYLLIQIQIRLEEDFLLHEHGDDYRAYLDKVPRLI